MAACTLTPVSAFMSTNLNSKITCFEQLADRIKRELGWPLVSLEIHQDGIYQNIQVAVEMYTKFAGYTQEYLIFDSRVYEENKGIRLDNLFTVYNTQLTQAKRIGEEKSASQDVGAYIETSPSVFVATSTMPASLFTSSSALSSVVSDDIECFQIVDCTTYHQIVDYSPSLSSYFRESRNKQISSQCETIEGKTGTGDCDDNCGTKFNNMFDYDVMDYRKVTAVVNFEEGSTTGINTLFTLEQTLAQQTYFSYALGNYGFDLVSWYTLKEWIDTREKMLAIRRSFKFDERTQYLTLYPQPTDKSEFYGVVQCYVERPIRDVIKELWVQKYALALTKIVIGRVRGKFQGVSLLGGGSFNYDLLEEGREEKAQLEEELKTGASPGWDSDPCIFIVA
jgi:hypothetical protein